MRYTNRHFTYLLTRYLLFSKQTGYTHSKHDSYRPTAHRQYVRRTGFTVTTC